jgi:hypothetical protein
MGYIEPVSSEFGATKCDFASKIVGTSIPPEYIAAVQKAFF